MTVRATKIQLLQESALTSMPGKNAVDLQQDDERAAPKPTVVIRNTPIGLMLFPLDPPLRKVYLEPAYTCNVNCRSCMRHYRARNLIVCPCRTTGASSALEQATSQLFCSAL
jgi:hypothetical protein